MDNRICNKAGLIAGVLLGVGLGRLSCDRNFKKIFDFGHVKAQPVDLSGEADFVTDKDINTADVIFTDERLSPDKRAEYLNRNYQGYILIEKAEDLYTVDFDNVEKPLVVCPSDTEHDEYLESLYALSKYLHDQEYKFKMIFI